MWVISRVISTLNGDTLIITPLIADLLSFLGLQVLYRNPLEEPLGAWFRGFRV